jgi:hypothetical protein
LICAGARATSLAAAIWQPQIPVAKVGQYPEIYCDNNPLTLKCTTHWVDSYADVPMLSMEEHISNAQH